MDTRAYLALYLGGTHSQETGTSPPSCLLLDNHLFMTLFESFLVHKFVVSFIKSYHFHFDHLAIYRLPQEFAPYQSKMSMKNINR